MSTLSELLAEHTELSATAVDHLQRVVAEWQLLADLSFADFVLWAPTSAADGEPEFLCVAHARPTTCATAYPRDQVGRPAPVPVRAQLARALRTGAIVREDEPRRHDGVPVRCDVIPVRLGAASEPIAVLARDANLAVAREPSAMEIAYLGCAADLCQMVADGSFPEPGGAPGPHTSPRVGDGMIRLDTTGTVVYASPNALSAYHRMGHAADLSGASLARLTRSLISDPFDAAEVVQQIHGALGGASGMRVEADARGASALFRALPLRPRGEPAGALVLVRDITEVRRRDRALLSKDATIREIHHRVKNNLQTVAALLRLQARRTSNAEARGALQESVRRVASIAMVHETLSMSVDERVDIDDVVDKVLPMMTDVSVEESQVRIRREGGLGVLAADLASPLVMVLTELVQNALEHAFDLGQVGEVVLRAERTARWLSVSIIDDGRGLPDGFVLERADRLGLQIVRTLVDSELAGTLELLRRDPRGTEAALRIPLTRRR